MMYNVSLFRMEDHLQTKWFFNRGLDTKIHLEYPQHLQGEINYYLNKEVLDLPVFEELNDNFIKALGSGILTQFAGPNDCLVYKHDPVNTIWYIKSGSMEVMDDDMVVAILGNDYDCDVIMYNMFDDDHRCWRPGGM